MARWSKSAESLNILVLRSRLPWPRQHSLVVGGRAARAREGGFTMDRALAGRRQAKVSIDLGEASLAGLHKTCPTLRPPRWRPDACFRSHWITDWRI